MAARTHSHRHTHRRADGTTYSHTGSHRHGSMAGRARTKTAASTKAKLHRAATHRRRDAFGRFR